jgi:hypothetical protein
VGGDDAAWKIAEYRDAGLGGLVLVGGLLQAWCHAGGAVRLVRHSGNSLEAARRASVAATLSLFVAAGGSARLEAQMRRVSGLQRDEVVTAA